MWWQDVQIERMLSLQSAPGNHLSISGRFSSRETTFDSHAQHAHRPTHKERAKTTTDRFQVPRSEHQCRTSQHLTPRIRTVFLERAISTSRVVQSLHAIFVEASFHPHHCRSPLGGGNEVSGSAHGTSAGASLKRHATPLRCVHGPRRTQPHGDRRRTGEP